MVKNINLIGNILIQVIEYVYELHHMELIKYYESLNNCPHLRRRLTVKTCYTTQTLRTIVKQFVVL